jgi:hypothetical protein
MAEKQEKQEKLSGAQQDVLDRGKEIKERSLKQQKDMTGWKPTPTQEENDLAAVGQHVMDKEPDGSPEEPVTAEFAPSGTTSRQMEGSRGRGYETRGAQGRTQQPQAQPQPQPHSGSHSTGHS